jgi:hypothetical protein
VRTNGERSLERDDERAIMSRKAGLAQLSEGIAAVAVHFHIADSLLRAAYYIRNSTSCRDGGFSPPAGDDPESRMKIPVS